MDAELAKFEAEMQKIEEENRQRKLAESKEDPELEEFHAEMKKVDAENAKRKSTEQEVGAVKKPKFVQPEIITAAPQYNLANAVPSSISRSHAPPALSGFLPGTLGAQANEMSLPKGYQISTAESVSRVDMTTGKPLPSSEQNMYSQQQSTYDIYSSKNAVGREASGPRHLRAGGGQVWEDVTMQEWPENAFLNTGTT